MSRVAPSAVLAAGIAAFIATPNAAVAGCYNCYAPPTCNNCYQPQYRTTYDTVMVSPGGVVAHRVPPKYGTVMVPQTVMVEPERVYHEQIPAQYATVPRVEMVAPAPIYVMPVQPRCGGCGSGGYGLFGGRGGYGYGYGAYGYGY